MLGEDLFLSTRNSEPGKEQGTLAGGGWRTNVSRVLSWRKGLRLLPVHHLCKRQESTVVKPLMLFKTQGLVPALALRRRQSRTQLTKRILMPR